MAAVGCPAGLGSIGTRIDRSDVLRALRPPGRGADDDRDHRNERQDDHHVSPRGDHPRIRIASGRHRDERRADRWEPGRARPDDSRGAGPASSTRTDPGGPLLNMAGQVVGINSAGSDTAENIGFAIAIDSAKETIQQAIANPLAPAAYLGISSQSVTPALAVQLGLAVQSGAYVIATTAGGPAQHAGIKSGDVVVAVDGKAVTSADDLSTILAGLRPGQSISVDLVSSS